MNEIVEYLGHVLERQEKLSDNIPTLQRMIWRLDEETNDVIKSAVDEARWDVLRDLAYDLNYYEPDQRLREQDRAYFGDDRAVRELREALEKVSLPES